MLFQNLSLAIKVAVPLSLPLDPMWACVMAKEDSGCDTCDFLGKV